jgi:hypothetical protein
MREVRSRSAVVGVQCRTAVIASSTGGPRAIIRRAEPRYSKDQVMAYGATWVSTATPGAGMNE